MFCAFLGHTGERLQDHWSSGFLVYAQNIDCGYMLNKAVLTSAHNGCPLFESKNKKKIVYP